MTFVPVIVPPPPVSPNAQELGRRIRDTIQDFEQSHPGTSQVDIEQALRLASTATAGAGRALVAVVAGLILALGLGIAVFLRAGGSLPQPLLLIAIVGAAIVGLALSFALKR